MKIIISLAMLALTCALQAKETIVPDKQVVFKTVGDVQLKLHIFNPDGLKPTDQRPAIVFFFGGGWAKGSPESFYQHSKEFNRIGIVAIPAEYRIRTLHHTTPYESVKDAKSAIRWVRQHAAELGVDPDRIIAAGGSAGGHIAACTSIIEGFEEEGQDLSISSKPNALMLYNPVIDTTKAGYGSSKFAADKQTELSPVHHISKGIPPTIIFHGTADTTVPFENVTRFKKLMEDAGNKCVLIPFEGKKHGFYNGSYYREGATDDAFNITMEEGIKFLKEIGMVNNLTGPVRK